MPDFVQDYPPGYGPVGPLGPTDVVDATAALLESLGYIHLSGAGPSAVWGEPVLDKDGAPALDDEGYVRTKNHKTQQELASTHLGKASPYAPTATTNGGGALEYDAQGRAYRNGVPDPRFDNYTKAAGYRAPSQAAAPAPRYPTSHITDRGDVYTVDPYTGVPTFQYNDPRLGTGEPNYEQKRQDAIADLLRQQGFTSTENDKTRTANATESAADRASRATESAADRAFRAGESAQDRAIRAAEFAAQQEAADRALEVQVETTNRGLQRQSEQDRLAAARQYADLVSSYDTAALPAYLAAGGGSYVNARQAQPGGLLTDNAIRPAAQSLEQARTIAYNPITIPERRGLVPPTTLAAVTMKPPVPSSPWYVDGVRQPTSPANFGESPTGAWYSSSPDEYNRMAALAARQQVNDGDNNPSTATSVAAPSGGQQSGNGGGGNATAEDYAAALEAAGFGGSLHDAGIPGYARGSRGFIRAPRRFVVNDAQPQDQEMIEVRPRGARDDIRVTPAGGFMRSMPHYANGTFDATLPATTVSPASSGVTTPYSTAVTNAADPAAVLSSTSASQPYVDEVRAFRRGLQPLDVGYGPYDPRFTRRVAPLLQQAYYANEQTRSGVPADVISFDADYYRPRGFTRGAMRLGY